MKRKSMKRTPGVIWGMFFYNGMRLNVVKYSCYIQYKDAVQAKTIFTKTLSLQYIKAWLEMQKNSPLITHETVC